MNLKTYDKIMDIFHAYKGFMSFEQLQAEKITIAQIKELEARKTLYKFARGCYWCTECGYSKPKNFKYIAVAKMNPDAVICLQSAAYLWGLTDREPEAIEVSIIRTDRKKMEFGFPINRHYMKNADWDSEIITVKEELGEYKVYAEARTICDCIRMSGIDDEKASCDMIERYYQRGGTKEEIYAYAKKLKAYRTVKNTLSSLESSSK